MRASADVMPELFVYTVAYDVGFAPNPFYGFCTLATCKAEVRQAADVGDWVVGVGSVSKGQAGRLVYALRVEEKLHYDKYWIDTRFKSKQPFRSGSTKQLYGDNVYHRPSTDDGWIQEDCRHSLNDGTPNLDHVKRDTKRPFVLISQTFCYFGDSAIEIPEEFRSWTGQDRFVALRSYRRNFPSELQERFVEWLESLISDIGIRGNPLDWKGHP